MQRTLTPLLRRLVLLCFWCVLPLLVGALLAFALVPRPQIGVIRIESVIWPESTPYLSELLEHARTDPNVRAVVLQINSPGGAVTPTEEIYFRLLELRQTKPVIVAIDDMAASGGYYLAAAGDYVFAKPSSIIGNVGVVSLLPSTDEQRFTSEDYVASGPFKFSGGSRGDYVRQIELAKLGFLEAVFAQRGEKLRADRERLSSGEIFAGTQALRLGLIDELGSNSAAIQKAAELGHIANYKVVDIADLVDVEEESESGAEYRLHVALQRDRPTWSQSLYYLYIEPEKRRP